MVMLVSLQLLVHLFGEVSSSSCANLALSQIARDNKSTFHLKVISTTENNFYVDDCLKSLSSEQEVVEVVMELTSLCQKGGYHLIKWISNSQAILVHIPKEDRADELRELDQDRDKLPREKNIWIIMECRG